MDDTRTSRGITGNLFEQRESEVVYNKLGKKLIPYLGKEWFNVLKDEFRKQYMVELSKKVKKDRKMYIVYPEPDKVFEAFKITPYSKVKLVIVGQDPYHNGNALGVSFGNNGSSFKQLNPSLQKIFEYLDYIYEIEELEFPSLNDYTLMRWADQGTLLLNRSLTVKKGLANSHSNIGWEIFTDNVIKSLNFSKKRIVFMLWGSNAKSLGKLVNTKRHLILTAEHPAAACYGNRMWNANDCFNKANEFFEYTGERRILW